MAAKRQSFVDRLADELHFPLSETARGAIDTWLTRLEEWNARVDLTAARSPEELVDLMLVDAFVVAPRIPRGVRLVDVGSGAGAPGLAIALLRPDLPVTLVEPLGKRVSFLRTVIGVLGRTDVTLVHGRGETLAGKGAFDVAISRATLPPPEWLALGVDLVVPGGAVWALLAGDAAPDHPRARLTDELPYTWPLTGATRRALTYRTSE
jgi:16S rRNA (guanine527-N7)-methyltransferase